MIAQGDLRQISYNDFGEMLATLTNQISEYCKSKAIKIDAIVPILRSGAFTGFHVASKLKITNILPIQYKYEYTPTEKIVRKLELPTNYSFDLPINPNILVTDSNTVTAGIAKKVIEDVRKAFPHAKIFFASANLDQSINKLDQVEQIFYGALSNESRALLPELASTKKITNDVIIFPWENIDEQWEDINSSQSK